MNTLAIVMIVKNEEENLARCLKQAAGLADKIYITDTGSTDRTREIAAAYGAAVSEYDWNQDFAAARNFALSQSECDWNLVLDADEYLAEGTREGIRGFLEQPDKIGAIELKNYYMEDTVGGKESIAYTYLYVSRLLPRGVRFVGKVHEQVDTDLPLVPVPLLFEHDGYLQKGKAERNLPILLAELKKEPKDSYFLYQTAETLRGLKRYEEACRYYGKFYEYVPKKGTGYRANGIINFLYALIEIKQWDKAFKIVEKEEKTLGDYADFHFVCGILFMRAILADTRKYISYLPRIEQSYLRCLEIGEVPAHQGVGGTGSFRAAYNLGTWYEVAGDMGRARECYQRAAKEKYRPALDRLAALKN